MLVTERYNLTLNEISEIVDMYRPLRASFDGHVSEFIFVKQYIKTCSRITEFHKPDNQDRSEKGDVTVVFDGVSLKIELKTILSGNRKTLKRNPHQVNTVEGSYWRGRFKTRTSSYKTITFSDGSQLNTLCVPRKQVDVFGVCVRPMTGKWEYMYCTTTDLPGTENKEFTPLQQQELLKPEMYVQWPPVFPWTDSLESALERAAAQKKNASVS